MDWPTHEEKRFSLGGACGVGMRLVRVHCAIEVVLSGGAPTPAGTSMLTM